MQLLNGGNGSQIGLAKSLAVVPGDITKADVYARYFKATGPPANLGTFATALLGAFGLSPPVAGEIGFF